jgi:hypothetical protein
VYLHKERAKDTNRLAMGSNIGPRHSFKINDEDAIGTARNEP